MLDTPSGILLLIFAAAGYLALLEAVLPRARDRTQRPLLAGVVLFICLIAAAFAALLYLALGRSMMVIYAVMALIAAAGLTMAVRSLIRERAAMRWPCVAAFALYGLLVVYVTLIMRCGTVTHAVRMQPLERAGLAVSTGRLDVLWHDLLNCLMFVPLGFLIPRLNGRALGRFGDAFLFGVIASAGIETIQWIFGLGECDVNDMIANTLGAALGWLLASLWARICRNWRLG